MNVRVKIEGYDDGDQQWCVVVIKPDEIGRSYWDYYKTRDEAEKGAAAARSYYRLTARGVEEPKP